LPTFTGKLAVLDCCCHEVMLRLTKRPV
jgi:hypothetical protein